MNEQIQDVETNLADIGMQCNPRVMAKKSTHLHQLTGQMTKDSTEERSFAAQLTLLHNCTSAVFKILRSRKSSVLAAKLLIVSRLLLKTLTQHQAVPPYVRNLGSQLESLRQTLLKRIDRRMVSAAATTHDIIGYMSAFCLATTSSFEDAIRHFHYIRSKAIGNCLSAPGATHDSVVEAFNLYIRTLQRTAELISGRLSHALSLLTAKPIMSDPTIQNMGELNIDMLQGWVSDDIKHFIPWIKHDVSKQDANKIMRKWSKESFGTFCVGAGNLLNRSDNFSELIDLRTQLLEAWLPVQNRTPAHSSLEVLQGLRDLINDRLISVLRAQSDGLKSLGLDISSTLNTWSETQDGKSVPSLWEPDLAFMDFSEGADAFKNEITNRRLGKSLAVSRVLDSYQTWMSVTQDRQTMIADLRRTKWEDVAEDEEDDEIEDIGGMLNDDDPHLLQTEHESSLTKAFASLHTQLVDALTNLKGEDCANRAAFMMRIIREIRRRIPAEYRTEGRDVFAQDLIPKLQQILVSEVVTGLRPSLLTNILKFRQSKCPGRSLWEGEPQLPIQPSPTAFKFLRELTAAMEHHGQDIWNPDAVDEMKRQLVEQLVNHIRAALEGVGASGNKKSNPSQDQEEDDDSANNDDSLSTETSSPQPADILRDCRIQLLFDMLYLSHVLERRQSQPAGEGGGIIGSVIKMLKESCELSDSETLANRAQEYWKRTELLFGLLT